MLMPSTITIEKLTTIAKMIILNKIMINKTFKSLFLHPPVPHH